MGEIIAVVSGKGGVGKTSATANIGVALGKLGRKVLIIDIDIGMGNLDLTLGLSNRIIFNINDVIRGTCIPEQAAIADKRFPNLFFIATSQRKMDDVNQDILSKVVRELKEGFDYILIDAPPGIGRGFQTAIAVADRVLVVVTQDTASVRAVHSVLTLVEDENNIDSFALINNYSEEEVNSVELEEISDVLAIGILGIIPQDPQFRRYINQGTPIVTINDSVAGIAYMEVAKRIVNNFASIEIDESAVATDEKLDFKLTKEQIYEFEQSIEEAMKKEQIIYRQPSQEEMKEIAKEIERGLRKNAMKYNSW